MARLGGMCLSYYGRAVSIQPRLSGCTHRIHRIVGPIIRGRHQLHLDVGAHRHARGGLHVQVALVRLLQSGFGDGGRTRVRRQAVGWSTGLVEGQWLELLR